MLTCLPVLIFAITLAGGLLSPTSKALPYAHLAQIPGLVPTRFMNEPFGEKNDQFHLFAIDPRMPVVRVTFEHR